MGCLILFNDPGASAWTCAGSGATFITDAADLTNGRPADQTVVTWPTGAQTTSTTLSLQRQWTSAQPIRVITIRGVSLVPGTKINVAGKRVGDTDFTYALGGNSTTGLIRKRDDGSYNLIILCDATNDPLIGIQVAIFNNVGGSTFYTAGQFIYVGEIMCFDSTEAAFETNRSWPFDIDGMPLERRGDNQPWILITRPFDLLSLTLSAVDFTAALGDAADPSALTYNALSSILANGAPCGAIVRYQAPDGSLDEWALHATSIFGVARKVTKPRHVGENYFELDLIFAESAPGN